MDLTISIVNYKVRDYLERCLESIFKYSSGLEIQVIVVDNASGDGSREMLKEKFPQVLLIENTMNMGYGCAQNKALPLARGRYILFLNPDIELLPDTLTKSLKFMDSHREAGSCHCLEVWRKEDADNQIIIPKPGRSIFLSLCKTINRVFPNALTKRWEASLIAKFLEAYHTATISLEDEYHEGGFLLVRREALRQTGGFAPQYFHGGEGKELTERLKKSGWKLYYLPTVCIIHYGLKSWQKVNPGEYALLVKSHLKRLGFPGETDYDQS